MSTRAFILFGIVFDFFDIDFNFVGKVFCCIDLLLLFVFLCVKFEFVFL